MSSDSDSSDDEHIKNLLASTDTNLFTKSLYEQKNEKIITRIDEIQTENLNSTNPLPAAESNVPKSQRYIDIEENCLDKELNISVSMQNYFAKKLSEFVDQKILFVDETNVKKKKKPKIKECTKLLSLSDNPINLNAEDTINYPKIRPKIRKNWIDELDEPTEELKIKSVVIDGDFILKQTDCTNWIDRKKSKIYRYKSKTGNPYQFVEDDNEFSKLRKKNVWSCKKIARTNH